MQFNMVDALLCVAIITDILGVLAIILIYRKFTII